MENITEYEEKADHVLRSMQNVVAYLKENVLSMSCQNILNRDKKNQPLGITHQNFVVNTENAEMFSKRSVSHNFDGKSKNQNSGNSYSTVDHHSTGDEISSQESKPLKFTSSNTSNECDFHMVETFLPKVSVVEEDTFSEGSHSVLTIAKLVSNLNEQQKLCNKLQKKIQFLENELTISKIQHELNFANSDDTAYGMYSGTFEEILYAQQEREAAILDRLQLANSERDKAVLKKIDCYKIKNSRQTNSEISDLHDNDMERLLDVLCQTESPQVVQKYCNSLLNLILTQNRKKSRLIKEEFGTLIQERNSTNLKKANKQCHIASLNSSVLVIQLQAMEEQVKMFAVYFSLSKSLQANKGHNCCKDTEKLLESLKIAHKHAELLEMHEKRSEKEIERLRNKNKRLERLVIVLQRKMLLETELSVTKEKKTQL